MIASTNGWALVFSTSSRFKVASSHSWQYIPGEINVLLPWIILQRLALSTLPMLSDSCCKLYTGCPRGANSLGLIQNLLELKAITSCCILSSLLLLKGTVKGKIVCLPN
jgi:hypothetical protein